MLQGQGCNIFLCDWKGFFFELYQFSLEIFRPFPTIQSPEPTEVTPRCFAGLTMFGVWRLAKKNGETMIQGDLQKWHWGYYDATVDGWNPAPVDR